MITKISVGSDVWLDVVHDLNSRCQATILSIEDEGLDTLENQKLGYFRGRENLTFPQTTP